MSPPGPAAHRGTDGDATVRARSPDGPRRATDFAGIPPARRARPHPGEVLRHPRAPGFGLPCPDGGYALLLAHLTETRVVLASGERLEDADWAVATVAMRRAGALGRAPLIEDIEVGRILLAYDDTDDAEFARWRARQLHGIAHDPDRLQELADAALGAAELRHPLDPDAVHNWRNALRQRV